MLLLTIANTADTSNAVSLKGYTGVGLIGPAALTGTQISFLVSDALEGTYSPLVDMAGTVIGVDKNTIVGNQVVLPPSMMVGVQFLKLLSDAAEAAERVFKLVEQEVL